MGHPEAAAVGMLHGDHLAGRTVGEPHTGAAQGHRQVRRGVAVHIGELLAGEPAPGCRSSPAQHPSASGPRRPPVALQRVALAVVEGELHAEAGFGDQVRRAQVGQRHARLMRSHADDVRRLRRRSSEIEIRDPEVLGELDGPVGGRLGHGLQPAEGGVAGAQHRTGRRGDLGRLGDPRIEGGLGDAAGQIGLSGRGRPGRCRTRLRGRGPGCCAGRSRCRPSRARTPR